jgi:glucose-1-phosphate adenylyltransferase
MDRSSERTLVMVLCGGKGERLYPLTKDRAKPSVPFLGIYRIVDFSLSNALNSGLRRIALLTQYKSLSLERHILTGWNIFHSESGDYIISLPAQGRVSDHWYEGTADAVFQNIYTIQQENPETVIILSGDHVYKADYRKILAFRAERDADAVALAKVVPAADASRFGIMQVDGENRIIDFLEKPKRPPALPGDPEKTLASMGVYVFRTPVLIKALLKDARTPGSSHDFGKDIIPKLIREHKLYAYVYDDYWEDIGTIDAYWRANMTFLSPSPPIPLMDPAWPVRSHKPQFPPVFVDGGDIRNSILGSGCHLAGCHVRNSVLSPNVRVREGADIADSIIFEDVEVGPGAHLRKVIIDKHSVIPAGFEIGYDDGRDAGSFKISRDGVRVVPKKWNPA